MEAPERPAVKSFNEMATEVGVEGAKAPEPMSDDEGYEIPEFNPDPYIAPPVEPNPEYVEAQSVSHIRGEAPVEEASAEEPVAEEAVEGEPKEVARPKNPFARNRVLEREKRQAAQREAQLMSELESLKKQVAELPTKLAPGNEEEDEAEVFQKSPATILLKRIEGIEKKLSDSEEMGRKLVEENQRQQMVLAAEHRLREAQKEAPEMMKAVGNHLARIIVANVANENPGATKERIAELSHAYLNELKIQAVASGADVAQVFYEKAEDFGFDPNAVQFDPTPEETTLAEEASGKKKVVKVKNETAKEKVAADKERSKATSSLGVAGGRGSQGGSFADRLLKADTQELSWFINKSRKDGTLRVARGQRVPAFGDLGRAIGLDNG